MTVALRARAAVLAAVRAASLDAQLLAAPAEYDDPARRLIAFGGVRAVGTDWAGTGGWWQERLTLSGVIEVDEPQDTDAASERAVERAGELYAGVEAAVLADPTLGGLVISALPRFDDLDFARTPDKGRRAVIMLSIDIEGARERHAPGG